jgi:hypothetical protein
MDLRSWFLPQLIAALADSAEEREPVLFLVSVLFTGWKPMLSSRANSQTGCALFTLNKSSLE